MKNILFIILLCCNQVSAKSVSPKKVGYSQQTKSAIKIFQKKDYKRAATSFFKIAFSGKVPVNEKIIAKYFLGLSLVKLKLFQVAAFPLTIVSRDGTSEKIKKSAFENLVTISDRLDDNTLLDYSLKNLKEGDLSGLSLELFYSRLASVQRGKGQIDDAIGSLNKTLKINPKNDEALYLLGLIYLKKNQNSEGLKYLEQLYDKYTAYSIRSAKRGAATMALGRGYYQAQRWVDAAALYREVSKDNPLYRQAQKELTWALFRMGKFRSAIGTVQTLHTPYYENFYDPESLQLRSIIMLFICQIEEVEKSLTTFEKVYIPTYGILSTLNSISNPPEFYSKEINDVQKYLLIAKNNDQIKYSGRIPLFLVRSAIDEAPLRNKLLYLKKIRAEQVLGSKIFFEKTAENVSLKGYILRTLDLRIKNTEKKSGEILDRMLRSKEEELSGFVADMSLLKYEMLSLKKSEAHKKYVESLRDIKASSTEEPVKRSFYTQNGYRYWPFEGEFWKDEVGNYQYMGDNRCEAK